MLQVYLTETHLVIVIEYASGGPLEERMLATGPLTEDTAKQLFRQLVDGLAFCHKKVSRPANDWHPPRARQPTSPVCSSLFRLLAIVHSSQHADAGEEAQHAAC